MANIFKEQLDVNQKPNRNNFDLSFQNHLTMKMGTLYPVFCKPVVPGDSFNIKAAFGLKFMPLVFPVQSKMRAHMHFFYVRNKNLFDRWQDWISGLKGNSDGVTPPYINKGGAFFGTRTLADYLGCPTTRVALENGQFVSHLLVDVLRQQTSSDQLVPEFFASSNRPFVEPIYFPSTEVAPVEVSMPLEPFRFHVHGDQITSPVFRLINSAGNNEFTYLRFASSKFKDDLSSYVRIPNIEANITIDSNNFVYQLDTVTVERINSLIDEGFYIRPYLVIRATTRLNEFVANLGTSFDFLIPQLNTDVEDIPDVIASDRRTYYDRNHISALPFRAYESIYNAYYRNSHGVDPFRINGSVEYNKFNTTVLGGADDTDYHLFQRNYELDFLTSALPSPQAGPAPLVGMSALGRITVEDENGITTAQATLDDDGNITKVAVTSPLASVDHARTLMNMAALGMNINDFRQVNALQRHLEQTLRSGYRYLDFIGGHHGVTPEYRELDMPEFIGGFSRDVTVSQILQNTDTEPILDALGQSGKGSPLGAFAGNANAFGGSEHDINHYCDDYGYIIGILSVVPTPAYSQLMPKHFLYRDRLDYYFPEFAQIGMQPITQEEVSPIQAFEQGALQETFGYQRPNYDLIASVDEVHGDFRDTLRDFLINRRFARSPELSPDFIKIHPEETNDIFANRTPSDDTILGQIVFQVFAKRPIPRVVIPSLGR